MSGERREADRTRPAAFPAELLDRMEGAVWIARADDPGRALHAGPRFEEVFGAPCAEPFADPPGWIDAIHADDRPIVSQSIRDLLAGRESVAVECRLGGAGDALRWARIHAFRSGGDPVLLVGSARDVTVRRKLDRALRDNVEKYASLMERSLQGVFVMEDADPPRILLANPAVAKILGRTEAELVGAPPEKTFSYIHDDDRDAVRERFRNRREGVSNPLPMHFRVIRKDGSVRWVDSFVWPVEYFGRPAFQAALVDITDRKRAEEEIRIQRDRLESTVRERTGSLRDMNRRLQEEVAIRKDAQERIRKLNERLEGRVRERTAELEKACAELQELDRLKDAFVSSVSHELRTPLTSIRSFSEFLLENAEEPDTRRHFLKIIHTETERLATLVEHVLEISRIESGGAGWTDEPFSIGMVLREAITAREEECRDRSITVDLALEEGIPDPKADFQRIRQVVDHLLDNAIKFSPDGGAIAVRAAPFRSRRSSDPGRWLKVSVADQGPGVEPEHQEAIFDRFFQVMSDVLVDKPKGTGLGLPICRKIVGRYGGNVWVEDAPGGGSVFTFTLPGPEEEREGGREPDAEILPEPEPASPDTLSVPSAP